MSQSSASLIEYRIGPNLYATVQKALDSLGAASNLSGAPLSNRNYFVDGQFDNWITPSGVTMTGGASYNNAATMYYANGGVGGVAVIQRNSFVPGAQIVGMTTPQQYYATYTQSTASSGTVSAGTTGAILQRVESVLTLAGQSATYSCWLWTTSGSITIPSLICRQNFGSGGSPSPVVIADKAVNWVVTTTPQRFSVRLDVPAVSGKTFGTTGDTLYAGLWLPPGGTFQLNTAQWQLEASSPQSSSDLTGNGGLPTPFEYRGIQAELARIQRYYYTDYTPTLISNGSGTFGGTAVTSYFKQSMRSPPSISYGALTGSATGGVTTISSNSNSFSVSFTSSQAAGSYYNSVPYIADARL